ncbi:MAG: hypothetical protein U1E73_00510 [Planctomycetota bacterium]
MNFRRTSSGRTCRLLSLGAASLAFSACTAAGNLLYEPKPTDPNDGYEGSLAQAGVNTEMDWGPKQNLLLTEYKTLREAHNGLQKRLDAALAESQNLKTRLNEAEDSHKREKAQRVQIEAQLELSRQKVSEQDATILSLRIEKAKVEQQALLAKIDLLKSSIDQMSPTSVEASAPPANR